MNGKIPGKQSIKNVLKKSTQDYKESGCEKAINRSKKRKGNPAKNALQEHGINFSSASKVSLDSEPEESDDFIPKVDSKPSSDLSRCMPNTAQEEENQIELAIQASLQGKHRGFDPNYLHPTVVNPAAIPMPCSLGQTLITTILHTFYRHNCHLIITSIMVAKLVLSPAVQQQVRKPNQQAILQRVRMPNQQIVLQTHLLV